MDNVVWVAIISGIASVVGTLIAVGLPLLKNNKELKTQNKDLKQKVDFMVSTGVAIGYYFNFIEMVYKVIAESRTIKLEIYGEDTTISITKEFDSNKVQMEIIIPRSLDGSSFFDAATRRDLSKKGDIVRVGNKRNFGINYKVQDSDVLVVVDMPGPLSAVEKYLKSLPEFSDTINPKTGQFDSKSDGDAYRMRQAAEIDNFIKTIQKLIKDNQYAINKVIFNNLT